MGVYESGVSLIRFTQFLFFGQTNLSAPCTPLFILLGAVFISRLCTAGCYSHFGLYWTLLLPNTTTFYSTLPHLFSFFFTLPTLSFDNPAPLCLCLLFVDLFLCLLHGPHILFIHSHIFILIFLLSPFYPFIIKSHHYNFLSKKTKQKYFKIIKITKTGILKNELMFFSFC